MAINASDGTSDPIFKDDLEKEVEACLPTYLAPSLKTDILSNKLFDWSEGTDPRKLDWRHFTVRAATEWGSGE